LLGGFSAARPHLKGASSCGAQQILTVSETGGASRYGAESNRKTCRALSNQDLAAGTLSRYFSGPRLGGIERQPLRDKF
jgi:hypothetical protein